MKTKPCGERSRTITLLLSALAMLFASCGSLQSFEKRKYMKGCYMNINKQAPTKAIEKIASIKNWEIKNQ